MRSLWWFAVVVLGLGLLVACQSGEQSVQTGGKAGSSASGSVKSAGRSGGAGGAEKKEVDLSAVRPDPKKGEEIYRNVCISCHGQDATGLPGLGQNLLTSGYLWETPIEEVARKLVHEGIPIDDPLNTGKQSAMPPMSSYNLTEADIVHVKAYLAQLRAKSGETGS